MSVTFFTPGAELGKYRLSENPDGSITIHLNDGEGVAAGWCTITSRLDAAHLRQMGADADALFIRRKAAQEAHDVIVFALDPDCRDGKHTSCAGGPCQCRCHPLEPMPLALAGEPTGDGLEPLPPLPECTPAGPPACPGCNDDHAAHDAPLPEPQPGGTIYPQLSEEALAGGEPLESLAPGPEEDEARRCPT